ncbi:MAG: hypothetical protein OEV49_12590 [candidate division Zixibacteria bacterium]|nr:hypothetical protein [candidate division Zixibacteria bacterium]MDH3936973.1 hypothetical protein [candidate division Zixibacteria bacterium]MDH4032794.1 hypothetical protein [candidate division Zixibacteria bacterium]
MSSAFGVILMVLNYFHDLAVAVLLVSIVTTNILGRYLDRSATPASLPKHLFAGLLRVSWIALAYIIAGGALRAAYFMEFEWNPAVGKGQVVALVVKHVILITMTIIGVTAHVKYYKKYGRTKS